MKPINKYLIVLLLMTSYLGSQAQSFMVLEKMGTKKRFTYYPGDLIMYKLKNSKDFEYGSINALLDSAFTVAGDTVYLKQVEQVNIRNKRTSPLLAAAGPTLIAAGVVLLGIDVINQGLVQGNGYSLDSGIGTTSLVLATAGTLIIILKKNKKHLGEKAWWRLRKVEVY